MVNVDPGETKEKNVGCGFGDLSDDVYELKIELTSADDIVDSGIDEQASDGVIWQRDGAITKYKIAGVTPNKRFWVVIWAEIKPKGGGGEGGEGGKIIRWMSVSDVDADADTDNDSTANPRVPSNNDEAEDFAEYPGYQAPPTVPGVVIGVNDDHDEFLPTTQPWGRDYDNNTADLTKEGTNYDNQSVGLAQIKVKVGVKRAPGTLKFTVPEKIKLFEGELPDAGKKGAAFAGDRRIDTTGEKTFIFYVEGLSYADVAEELVITYTPEGGDGEAVDTICMTPVQMDIDVDSDNSDTIDDDDDLLEAKPEELGMVAPVVTDVDDRTNAKPGILRGISPCLAYLIEDHTPVITLKKLPGSTGDIRVWKVREGQDPVLMLDTSSGGGSTTQDGDGSSIFDLLAEGSDCDILITALTPGEVLLGLQITVNGAKVAMDVVRVQGGIDLDVDSDNNDGRGDPARTPDEETVEDKDGEPGKIIAVNDNDDDEDGIPDFADGFDRDAPTANDDDSNDNEQDFVPIWIEIPPTVDPDDAKVKFDYSASDPAHCTATQPADGHLRIWTKIKDGAGKRDKRAVEDSGDFVPTATTMPWSSLPDAPVTPANPRIKRVFVEAVRASTGLGSDAITAIMLPDGTNELTSDTIRLTAVRTTILADTNRDGSVTDADEDGKKTFSTTKGAIIIVNSDDDDSDSSKDNSDNSINGVDDLADMTELVLHKTLLHDLSALPTGWKIELAVSTSDASKLQVFDAMDVSATRRILNGTAAYEVPFDSLKNATGGKLSYAAEASSFPTDSFSGLICVYLRLVNNKSDVVYQDEVMLAVAPYLMSANTDTVTQAWVSDLDAPFVAALRELIEGKTPPPPAATGATLSTIAYGNASTKYHRDRWVQDEFEFGYTSRPTGAAAEEVIHVCLNSPRDRGLDPYPEDDLLGPNFGEYDAPGTGDTGDSYGNLEVTPPFTGWDRGAIYFGDSMSTASKRFLAAQRNQAKRDNGTATAATGTTLTDSAKAWATNSWSGGVVIITSGKGRGQVRVVASNTGTALTVSAAWTIQPNTTSKYIVTKAVELPTSWLTVKHADEVLSFVPDAGGDFKLLIADPCLGLKLLADQLAETEAGNVASGTNTTLTRAGGTNWPTDKWKDGAVYITAGKGKGQFRTVSANTATVATVTRAWDDNPDATSTYKLYALRINGQATEAAAADNQLKHGGAGWTANQWQNGFVKITAGACEGQVRQIASNTTEVLTTSRNWSSQSDNGTATSGTNNALTDNTKTWATNLWQGAEVRITAGTGSGQVRTVSSSNATALTVSANWTTNPDNTSQYTVIVKRPNASSQYELRGRGNYRALFFENGEDAGVASTSLASNDRLVDVTKTWAANAWNGGWVIVYHDAGTVEVHEIAGSGSTNDNGTSSAATNTTLTDTAKTWTADEWKGGTIEITAGPGSGQIRTISANTATAITVSSAWDVNPFKSDNGTATGSTNTTLSDNTKNWQGNEWQGAEVEITAGTGQGQKRTITGNTATQITVGAAWATNPDATSQYTIRLGATYQLKIAYLQTSAAWTNNPSEASRYVVVKKSRFWDEYAASPSAPSACTIQDILTGVDLGFPGSKDNSAPVKNQAMWSRIWHDSDGVLATFRSGVGAANLPDSKIIPVPALYIMDGTTVGATSDADALVPGMVNLLVVKGSAATRAIIARPFACQAGGNDVFETTLNASLGGVIGRSYIDCWTSYHIALGEVHCGTNVKRDPPTDKRWWDE